MIGSVGRGEGKRPVLDRPRDGGCLVVTGLAEEAGGYWVGDARAVGRVLQWNNG
jgi:hypothetical protein